MSMMVMPLKMQPCYKEYLWGGTRLKSEFGNTDAPTITAESWELACHPDGLSTVADGIYKGMTIDELGEIGRDQFWGTDCRTKTFPLLVKMIDAEKPLSVQVHPSDALALKQIGEQGKVEMWYIVDCIPNAYIYLGFSKSIKKEEFLQYSRDGNLDGCLNRVPIKRGDVFYILPGTIHAIGAGILIAEIQQNSNTTFRVYDYQRRDASGNLRTLHIERAMQVLDFEPMIPEECKANSSAFFAEFSMVEMFSCSYFKAFRLDVHSTANLLCDGRSFQHILCVEGNGVISSCGIDYPFNRGDSFFLPASLGEYKIMGVCRVLLSRV